MESITIDKLVDEENDSIDSKELRFFLNQKLNELYEKDKTTPIFDYEDIRYSAMIDLIYDMMPSLREDIKLDDAQKPTNKTIIIKE